MKICVPISFRCLSNNGVNITIQNVDSVDSQPSEARLKLNEKLSNIRKTLKGENIINDTMLFAEKDRHTEIKTDDERNRKLKSIIEKKSGIRTIYLKFNDKTDVNSKQSEDITNINNGSNRSSLDEKIISETDHDDVGIVIQIDDLPHAFVPLNRKFTLSKIREKLEQSTEVKMNEALLFAKNHNNKFAIIGKEYEGKINLETILENENVLHLKYSDEVEITIRITDISDPSQKRVLVVNLNPKSSLSEIREILESNREIRMCYMLTFLNKTTNGNRNGSFAEIARKDEEKKFLTEIVDMKDKILYLQCQNNIDIMVQVDNPPLNCVLVNLNPKCVLSEIRISLEQDLKVKMNEVLLFAERNHNNNSLRAIAKEEEGEIKLEDIIIEKENKVLYLKYSNKVEIKVHILNEKFVLVNLNPKDNLLNVRKILEKKNIMDYMLSFLSKDSQTNEFAEIQSEDEEKKALLEIVDMKDKILYLKQNNVSVTVNVNSLIENVTVNLYLKEKLSNIRAILKQNSEIKMDDALLFANKTRTDTAEFSISVIAKEHEEEKILEEIIEEGTKTLYLKQVKTEFLKNHLKLEYGYSTALEKASKKAFTIIWTETDDVNGHKKEKIEIDSEEDQIMRKDLLLTADIDLPTFEKFGVLIEKSRINKSNVEASSSCIVIEYSKKTLKYELQPTEEFTKVVEGLVESKDLRKLEEIIKEFGQFIPLEVTLGGRAYFIESRIMREDSVKNTNDKTVRIGSKFGHAMIGKKTDKSLIRRNTSKYKRFKLFGGELLASDNFNETKWAASLNNFRKWKCINIKNPISIFQPLDENLRNQVLRLIGKKIHYSIAEPFKYTLEKPYWKPEKFEMKIPDNVSEIIQNEESDCSFFATIIDTENVKKDMLNCQILWPSSNRNPSLLIHCIQKVSKRRDCKLKILWMVIGYDVNFNFNSSDSNVQLKVLKNHFKPSGLEMVKSLDLERDSSDLCVGIPVLNKLDSSNNSLVIGHHFFNGEDKKIGLYMFSYSLTEYRHTNLPDFTFYTLVISNYSSSDFGKLSLDKKEDNLSRSGPKYISLFSTGKNSYGPVFLKQKYNGKKIKYVDTITCKRGDCICKSRKLKELEYATFIPKYESLD